MTSPDRPNRTSPGLVVGGRGGPEDELLNDGQEEVFSRSEVELGRIEHDAAAGGASESPSEKADLLE